MGNREKLELLFLIRPEHVSAVDKEREVHWMLRRHRTRGEWFNVSLDRAIASAMRAMENLRPEGTATEQRFEKFTRPMDTMWDNRPARKSVGLGKRVSFMLD